MNIAITNGFYTDLILPTKALMKRSRRDMGWAYDDDEDLERYIMSSGSGYQRRRQNGGVGWLVLVILILLVVGASWLGLQSFGLSPYQPFTDGMKVAHVQAMTADVAGHMQVNLTLYVKDGQQISMGPYNVQGDTWLLQARILTRQWGLSSGYELTRLGGRDTNGQVRPAHLIGDASNSDDNNGNLTSGNDDSYHAFSQIVEVPPVYAKPGLKPDEKAYDVFISSQGLYLRPSNSVE